MWTSLLHIFSLTEIQVALCEIRCGLTHRVKYSGAVEMLKDEILLLTAESKLQLSTHLSGKFAKEKPGRSGHHCCFA